MENSFHLTPFFIDSPTPGLKKIAGPDWKILEAALPEGSKQERLATFYPDLANWVSETARAGKRPVSIAGDCVTSIAVLAGLQDAGFDPLLIWFDAHGDFNTWETSPSGFLGGMPLAMLSGRGEQTICNAVGLTHLPENQIVLTDARDLDPGEREAVASSEIIHLSSAGSLAAFTPKNRSVWVHFDCDILRPEDAPAMNYLAPGGPSTSEMERVFKHLARTEKVVAVSLSSWNPEMDTDGKTAETCMALLGCLLGG
jgi:arginase